MVIQAFAKVLESIPDASLAFVGSDKGVRVSKEKEISIGELIEGCIPNDKK